MLPKIHSDKMAEESGPDRILPCDNLTTWERDGCVKIRKTKDWPANRDTMSLPTFVRKQCESGGAQTAMIVKRNGKQVTWTYDEYYQDIITTSKAFVALGLEERKAVCIFGFNSPEWFFAYHGAYFSNGMVRLLNVDLETSTRCNLTLK